MDTSAHKDVQRIECTPNTPIVVKAETATVLKADTTSLSKLASQGTSPRVIETSSIEHCKETGIFTKYPAHAETVTTQADDSVSRPYNKQLALHVVTANENTSQSPNLDECSKPPNDASQGTTQTNNDAPAKRAVMCPEDSLVLLQYPWKCELNVKLDRIQPLEIDIWSKKVCNYHVFSTFKVDTPIISDVKGYGLRKRPIKVEPQVEGLDEDKMDQLIDHAKALIDMAKTFVTKPVSHKQPRKQPTAKPIKSSDKAQALDILHGVTMNKLATLHVETDGTS